MPNQTYELATSCHNQSGNFFMNVFAFDVAEAGGFNAFDYALDLINQFIASNQADYLALFGTDVVLDFYTAKRVTGTRGPAATKISGANGSGGTDSISAGLAADIAWLNGSPTNRLGHNFIPACPQGKIDGDTWVGAFLVTVTSFINTMISPLTLIGPSTATFSTFSRKLGGVQHITGGLLRPKATMMNRRLKPQI